MKRLRRPKVKVGELCVYWGVLDCNSPDIIFEWRGESSMRRDSQLLYYHLASQQPDWHEKPLFSKMKPSLIEELESRGYDITTLKFSIIKKVTDKEVLEEQS